MEVFFVCLQTVKCIVGSTQLLSVHLTVLNEKLVTHSFHTICIYLFITNNICKDSVKEQGVEVPLRIQKDLKLINIMLIYIYVYIYILYCTVSQKHGLSYLTPLRSFLVRLIMVMHPILTTMFMTSP